MTSRFFNHLSLLLLLVAITSHASAQKASWLRTESFSGEEEVQLIEYIPTDTPERAAIWSFQSGVVPGGPGGAPDRIETWLKAYQENTGMLLFQKKAGNVHIMKIKYNPATDRILMLSLVSGNDLAPSFIGSDILKDDTLCYALRLLEYNHTGALVGNTQFPISCGHDATYVDADIDVASGKIVVAGHIHGDMFLDSTLYEFGTEQRFLRRDTSYMSVWEWSFAGDALHLDLFAQPSYVGPTSRFNTVCYGNSGDVYLGGWLLGPCTFDTVTINKVPEKSASFIVRYKPGSHVLAGAKVWEGVADGNMNDMIFNPFNKKVYFLHSWADSLMPMTGNIHFGAPGLAANMMIGSLDSTLHLQHYNYLRSGDTSTIFETTLVNRQLAADAQGRIYSSGYLHDSFMVKERMYYTLQDRFAFKASVFRFNPDLDLDTFYLSNTPMDHGIVLGEKIAVGNGDEVFVGGSFSGVCIFPPASRSTASGNKDAYIAKLSFASDQPTSIGDRTINKDEINTFPNPATSAITISLKKGQFLQVYNGQGQLMKSAKLKTGEEKLQLSVQHWPRGIYYIRSITNKGEVGKSSFVLY